MPVCVYVCGYVMYIYGNAHECVVCMYVCGVGGVNMYMGVYVCGIYVRVCACVCGMYKCMWYVGYTYMYLCVWCLCMYTCVVNVVYICI